MRKFSVLVLVTFQCLHSVSQTKPYTTSIEVQSGIHVRWNQIDIPQSVFVNSLGNLGLSANSLLYRRDYEKYSFLLGFSHINYYQSFVFALQNKRPQYSSVGPNHTFYLNSGFGKNFQFDGFSIRPEIVLGVGYVDDALYSKRNNNESVGEGHGLISDNTTDTILFYQQTSYSDNVLHFNATFSNQFSYAIGKHFDFCLTPYFTKGLNTVQRTELDYFFKDDNGPRIYGDGNIRHKGTQFGLRFGMVYHLTEGKDFSGKQLKRNDWAIEASYLFRGFLFDNIHDVTGNHSELDNPYNSSNMRLAFILNKEKYYITHSLEMSQYFVGFMKSNVLDAPILPFWIMPNRLYYSLGLGKKVSYGNFHINPSIRLGSGIGYSSFDGFEIDKHNVGVPSDEYFIEAYSNNSLVHFRFASKLALEYTLFKNFYVSVFPEYIQGINHRTKIHAEYTYSTGETGSIQVNSRGSMFGFGWAVGWYMK